MTSFSNLLPTAGANRSPLTDEELQRLALLLQQRGEGLASINAQEAQMLKDAGGSGKPLPGTKGLGVGGGPIRSYDEADDAGFDSDAPSSEPEKERTSIDKQFEKDPKTRVQDMIDEEEKQRQRDKEGGGGPREGSIREHNGITYIFQNGSWQAQKNKGPDDDGNMHFSQAEVDAANSRIRLRKATAKLQEDAEEFTGDQTFDLWYQQNKAGYEGVSEDDLRKVFNDQMLVVTKESDAQTADLKGKVVNLFNDGTFSARGKRIRNADGTISDIIPTTFEEADEIFSGMEADFARLSTAQKREVLEDALKEFARIEAFTLTIEDVDRFTRPAPEMDDIVDITATDIASVGDVQATTVGDVADVEVTTLEDVLNVASDAGELADVIQDEDALIQILKSRVAGEEPSVAEIQLKRGTENNIKALVSTTTGEMDPAKLRQARNMFMSVQQIFTGQKAELRAAEQVQAEQNLLAVLKAKGTREASIQIANMEKDIQMSIQQGDLDQARRIKDQQAALVLVTTQAEIEKDERLANLDKERILAIEQGKMDLATKIANLEKNILISKVNTQVALESRKMDDSLAIAAFQGEQSLQGLETEIDLATMKDDLTRYGFQIQKDLALMDRETQLAVARLMGEYKMEIAKTERDSDRENSILGAIATVASAYVKFTS
jgi:hypothetical protein